MVYFPNAKINLGLNIVSKRSDGYHNLETIFYPLSLCDALELAVKENFDKSDSFFLHGLQLDSIPSDNLVLKALNLLRNHYDKIPFLEIHLLKKIPFGAGLGGGSSDAAYMLKLVNQCCDLHLDDECLADYALQLGADCPFFIYNRPLLAKGVGEKLEAIDFSLSGYYFVLVHPNIYISTKEAFSNMSLKEPDLSLADLITRPIDSWKGLMINDFEKNIFIKYPFIKQIKEMLYRHGAVYASMTGSGSSVYGIYKEKPVGMKKIFPNCYVWEEQAL